MQFVVGKVEIHMQTPKLPRRQNDFKNAKLTFLYIFVTANPWATVIWKKTQWQEI